MMTSSRSLAIPAVVADAGRAGIGDELQGWF
jgi:hypothetical protein